MFLPLGDEPNPRGVPWVTYGLIAANVGAYLFITLPLGLTAPDPNDPALGDYVRAISQWLPPDVSWQQLLANLSAYDLFTFAYGYRPAHPSALTLFTAMFLHSGFLHLAGNMLFLWIYGDNVEHRLGPPMFLFWYLATGAAATLIHSWFDTGSALPVIGASGAISGVLGFYFLWFPHNRVRLWIFLFPLFADVVLVPARLVLGLFLIVENMLPFLASRGAQGGGVAYGAHIGGFVAGLLVAWVMNLRERREQPAEFDRTPSAPATPVPVGPGETIAGAIRDERFADAANLYFSLPPDRTVRVLSPEVSLALADWLRANGHARAAIAVYQRHLRDYPIGPGAAEAHAGLGIAQLYAFGQPAAAYQHFVEALGLDPLPHTEAIVRQALNEIRSRQKFQVGRTS